MLKFNSTTLQITDTRDPADKVFSRGGLRVCYTLDSDNITKGEKLKFTPYNDRIGEFDDELKNERTRAALDVKAYADGLEFSLASAANDLSEFGIDLPFNFMGKKGGGGWRRQFMLNSPYISPNRDILYFYLARPNGNNIVIAAKNAAGFKIDYSPYCYAHFLTGIKIFANLDKAYGMPRKDNTVTFAILPVNGFDDCLNKLSRYYGLPFVECDLNGGEVGSKINVKVYGKCDNIKNGDYVIGREGDNEITPKYNGKSGATATVYGYRSLKDLYFKSMSAVDMKDIEVTDKNLCEHQCWATAMLRFLLRYKSELDVETVIKYETLLKDLLDEITETDESKAVPRLTILKQPHDNLPAYNVYKSTRVQEGFFGVTLLFDAYKYFGDKKYLDYAVGALDCLLDNYQNESGAIMRYEWGKYSDYTTVCCPMITTVDAAFFMRDIDKAKSDKYYDSAKRMAEYLYERGLVFPTEGAVSDETETEMEDGSISCTALGLLYYCKNVERVEKYIRKAKEILDIHDCWVMQTPVAQMRRSTLRWWETLWEGDADGPALCCGHSWSIWRAEADFLYYMLTGDEDYLIRAKNGFNCNLAKIHGDGKSYSIYGFDEITGGGFASKSDDVKIELAPHYARRSDSGLTRYVWVRLCDTFLNGGTD